MGRLIKIHEIDEFSEVKNIPNGAITNAILSNVRNLDEKSELERFVREILYDPNETPHGPTEIADILTTHVHIMGEKQLAAFVLKGKSFQRVSSKSITHQFAKLRPIPGLGLMVFGAVGDIQDDALRDFAQTASDAKCDHLIIDAQDFARLLIAYEKICPKDGTPYNEKGACKNGHVQDEGLTLEWEVRGKTRYSIIGPKDVSHLGAKRYVATILLDEHYKKDVIRTIIQEATEKIKLSNYYRNEQVKTRWGKTPAHVVWLDIACYLEDIQASNWFCQTLWINPSLPEDMRPLGLGGNERLGDIEILWNDEYKSYKKIFESSYGNKEEVLEANNLILKELVQLGKQAIEYFGKYRQGNISEEELISKMQEKEPRVTELYQQSGNIPMSCPQDCKDYIESCQNAFTDVHNMFLYYSKSGLKTWPKENRDWLMQDAVEQFYSDLERIKFEESKV